MLPWLPTIIKEMCEKDVGSFSSFVNFCPKVGLKAVWEFVHSKILGAKEGAQLSANDATFIGSMFSTNFLVKHNHFRFC